MHAALDVYEANKEKRFLDLAQWAADWTLTWMYFHDIGLRKDSVLYGHLHSVGWTLVSTQNQEIDVFAYWMAPDYCRLGLLLHDPRYQQIAKVMYDACTQTIARPGRMFGQSALASRPSTTIIRTAPMWAASRGPGVERSTRWASVG
jgi:hypothetical protein